MNECVPNTNVWIGMVMSFDHFGLNDFVLFVFVVASLISGWLLSDDEEEDRVIEDFDIALMDDDTGVDEEKLRLFTFSEYCYY